MIQPGVGIVCMFGLGRLHTASRVLAVLLLQVGQAEAAGEEADDEDPHDDHHRLTPVWLLTQNMFSPWLFHSLNPQWSQCWTLHHSPPRTLSSPQHKARLGKKINEEESFQCRVFFVNIWRSRGLERPSNRALMSVGRQKAVCGLESWWPPPASWLPDWHQPAFHSDLCRVLTCPSSPLTSPPDNNLSLIRNSQPRRTKHKNLTDMGPQTSDPVSHIIRKILRIFQDNSTFRKIWEILSWNTDWLSVTWNNFILVISASASRSTEWGRVSRWNKEREI